MEVEPEFFHLKVVSQILLILFFFLSHKRQVWASKPVVGRSISRLQEPDPTVCHLKINAIFPVRS